MGCLGAIALLVGAFLVATSRSAAPTPPAVTKGAPPARVGAADWAVDGTSDSSSTHHWMVDNAIKSLVAANALAGNQNAVSLLATLDDASGACQASWRKGLKDADYLPAYNDGIDTNQSEFGQGVDAWLNGGWKSHFYDPDTEKNYRGETDRTAFTQAQQFYRISLDIAADSGALTAAACYRLGLALHYMTDVTQPMHAANYTNLSLPTMRHATFETWVKTSVQASVPQPPWEDMQALTAPEILRAAAVNAKGHWKGDLINVSSDHVDWQSDASILGATQTTLRRGTQYTANYLARWIKDVAGFTGKFVDTITAEADLSGPKVLRGTTVTVSCEPDEVAVGMYGSLDQSLNWPEVMNGRVVTYGFYCARVRRDGGWADIHQTAPRGRGAPAANTFEETCPAGYAMSGLFSSRSSPPYLPLSSIGFTCTSLTNPNQAVWRSVERGLPHFPSAVACPPGEIIQRFRVNDQNDLGYLEGFCAPLDPNLVGDGTPRSCAEVRAATGAGDGLATIHVGAGTAVDVQCVDMASSPKEYLPLPRSKANGSPLSNFSAYFTTGPGGAGVFQLRTWFEMVRFLPDTMGVDTSDITYATKDDPQGIVVDGQRRLANPYAEAGDCLGAGSTRGAANIDLRGTPFLVDARQLSPQGNSAGGGATYGEVPQVLDLTGGGACGVTRSKGGRLGLITQRSGSLGLTGDGAHADAGALALPADFTLEAWAKPAYLGSDQVVLAKDVGCQSANQARLVIDASGHVYFSMTDASGDGGGMWDGHDYLLKSRSAAIPGVWSHLAVAKSGTLFTLYFDGALEATFTASKSLLHTGTQPFLIGVREGCGPSPFVGEIDEVRVWSRARTPAEIDAGALGPVAASTPGLLADYTFDEGAGPTARDATGAHDAKLVGTAFFSAGEPPRGGALVTSSSTGSHVETSPFAVPDDFAMEAWIKPSPSTVERIVLAQQAGCQGPNQLRLVLDASNRPAFTMTDGSGADGGLSSASGYALVAPNALPEAAWSHVAITKSGAVMALYVNGVSQATFTTSARLGQRGPAPLAIGGSPGCATAAFDGAISDVRVWKYARRAPEIISSMRARFTVPQPEMGALLAYYHLEDGGGTFARDRKRAHDGTLLNGPAWTSDAP